MKWEEVDRLLARGRASDGSNEARVRSQTLLELKSKVRAHTGQEPQMSETRGRVPTWIAPTVYGAVANQLLRVRRTE